jgi:hypothetical protein
MILAMASLSVGLCGASATPPRVFEFAAERVAAGAALLERPAGVGDRVAGIGPDLV